MVAASVSRYSFGSEQPTPDHEHLAEVLGQSLVDPEEPCLLRRVEIGRAHAGGPAKLAAPGMHILVRQQIGDPALGLESSIRSRLRTPLMLDVRCSSPR